MKIRKPLVIRIRDISSHPLFVSLNKRVVLPVLLFSLIFLTPLCVFAYTIEGYLSSFSVTQGNSIDLYTSTSSSTYEVEIRKVGVIMKLVATYEDIAGTHFPTPDDAWATGAQWENPLTISIPNDWESGIYELKLETNDSSHYLNFIVKEDIPGSKSSILFLDNASTKIAYNAWGGKSLYNYNSLDNIKATSLSKLRPGQNRSYVEEIEFVNWADTMAIDLEHASIIDLHNDSSLLGHYKILVISGHSEYWSKTMRNNFDNFVLSGGKALILSGNTMWWQIRMEEDNMVCYKNSKSDPLYGIADSEVTTKFYKDPLNDPENRSIGVSWRSGGYVNSHGFLPAHEGYGGYTVTREDHQLFSGTGLINGDVLGQESTIVGYETDGALFNWVDDKPIVTGEDGTPLNFEILGYSPAQTPNWSGNATMGIFSSGENGGMVFNAATVDWADGLWSKPESIIADPLVSKITLNVLSLFDPIGGASCINNTSTVDTDEDDIDDVCDNCVSTQNANQTDTDDDGTGNDCDMDDDNDGVLDTDDAFPLDPTRSVAESSGDGGGSGGSVGLLCLSLFGLIAFARRKTV